MPIQIVIDGIIGWDVIPSEIRAQLKAAKGEDVEILFSSEGGYISDGLAIFNHIHDYEGKTTAIIIGMVASMASYIPLAADKVIAKSNAVYMIHDALMLTYGNEAEHNKAAKILGGFSDMLTDIYAQKTGKTRASIRDMLREESYFFGSEMLDAGFVDEIDEIEINGENDDIILDAMARSEAATARLREKPENIGKIAAILKPAAKNEQSPGTESPARRTSAKSKNPNEEKIMDLKQFLVENPEAKNEHDALVVAAERKGADSVQARVDRIKPFLTAEYPDKVKAQAAKVLSGEASVEMFEMAVAMMDAGAESKNSDDADGEQEPDTPAGTQEKSTDGIIRSDEDEAAAIAKLKGLK